MHRLLFAVYRKEGWSHEDFIAHYRDVHIPMGRGFDGMVEYDIFPVNGGGDDAPDAFAVWAFESEEAFQAALASEQGQSQQKDAETFTGRADVYMVDRFDGMS
jgi:uncharacterized protein (TIGR02118 family)